jgi:hypothetical protein
MRLLVKYRGKTVASKCPHCDVSTDKAIQVIERIGNTTQPAMTNASAEPRFDRFFSFFATVSSFITSGILLY